MEAGGQGAWLYCSKDGGRLKRSNLNQQLSALISARLSLPSFFSSFSFCVLFD